MNGGASPEKKVFLILWFAFVQTVVVYGAILFILRIPAKKLPFDDLSFLAIAAGLAALPHLIGSIYQFRKNFSMAFYIVRLALAETAAIFGLVMFFIFGCKELSLKAAGISLLSLVFLFPLKYLKKKDDGQIDRPPPIE